MKYNNIEVEQLGIYLNTPHKKSNKFTGLNTILYKAQYLLPESGQMRSSIVMATFSISDCLWMGVSTLSRIA